MKTINPGDDKSNDFQPEEEAAFSAAFHKYYSDLYQYGLKITRNEELTRDGIQELFVTLWKNKIRLSQVKSVKFYLLKSLRRSLIRAIQKDRKGFLRLELFSAQQDNFEFSHEELVIEDQNRNEKKDRLLKMINDLPKRQKEVIFLKYYEELSYEEIAEVMALNYQSVINHIHKAFKALRRSGFYNIIMVVLMNIKLNHIFHG